jgi:hypothetical protein
MILRRLGPSPAASSCPAGHECPDIFELKDGDFAIIGMDITDEARAALPADAGCGRNERIVRIPRKLLVEALPDIPAKV